MKEIVLDTETTGLSVKEGHRIVEIGCIELDNLIPTNNKFHCFLNPQRKVSEKAFQVHGYSDEFLSQRLVIHNAEFDLSHLNNELQLLGKEKISNEIVDTLELARNKYPGSQISLDALCKKFRIDNSKRKVHTALIDCDLLSKVYINLIDQKEPKLNFKDTETFNTENITGNTLYFKKVINPSKEEILSHKKFLNSNLKKNFF